MANFSTIMMVKMKLIVPLLFLLLRVSCTIDSRKPLNEVPTTHLPIRVNVVNENGTVYLEMRKNGSGYFFQPISSDGKPLARNPSIEDLDTSSLGKIIEEQYASSSHSAVKKESVDVSEQKEHDENLEKKPATGTNIDTQELKGPSSPEQSFNQSSFKQTGRTFNMNENKGKNVDVDAVKSPYGLTNDDAGGDGFSKVSSNNRNMNKEFHLFPEYINSSSLNPKNQSTLGQSTSQAELLPLSNNDLGIQQGRVPSTTDNATDLTQDNKISSSSFPKKNMTRPPAQGTFPQYRNPNAKISHNRKVTPSKVSRSRTPLRTIGFGVSNRKNSIPNRFKVSRTISINKNSKRITIVFASEDSETRKIKNALLKPQVKNPRPYPDTPVENVTCISFQVFSERKRTLTSIYQKPPGSCPSNFPCKNYQSCSLWNAGWVGEDFKINDWTAQSYLTDLFKDLHPKKINHIKTSFKNCFSSRRKGHFESRPDKWIKSDSDPKTTKLGNSYFYIDCESTIQSFRECLITTQSKGICLSPGLTSPIEI